MTFLDNLQSHKGSLVQLKTQLYWYDGQGWDNNPGRICLLLDAEAVTTFTAAGDAETRTAAATADGLAVALLLTEGQPQWIWLAEQDVEVIDEAR